jgi:hypothetical protein
MDANMTYLVEKIRVLEDKVKELERWIRNYEYMQMMEENKKANKETK